MEINNKIISYTANVFIVKDTEKTREFSRTFDSDDFLQNRNDALDYAISLAEAINEAAHIGIDNVDKNKIREFKLDQLHQFELMNISLIGCMVLCNLPNPFFGSRIDLYGSDYYDLGGQEHMDIYNNNLKALQLELDLLLEATGTKPDYMIVENLNQQQFKILNHRVEDVCMAMKWKGV